MRLLIRLIPLLVLPLLPIASHGAGEVNEHPLKRWFFSGVIGDAKSIHMEFGQSLDDAASWDGFYYRDNGDGQRLRLEGAVEADGSFRLTEWTPGATYDEDDTASGRFTGKFEADFSHATGNWSSMDETQQLRFELRQLVGYQQLSEATPFSVEKPSDMECPCEADPKAKSTPPDRCACIARGALTYPLLTKDGLEGVRSIGLLNGPSKEDRESGDGFSWGDSLTLEHLSDKLISLRVDNYFMYFGATHPMDSVFGVLLGATDAKEFKQLTLDQVYSASEKCLGRLNEMIRTDLASQEAPAVMDEYDSWGVDLEKLYATTFLYRAGHLIFLYSPYEVGPYAMGPFEARAPLKELAECIPSKSPLAIYAK